MGTNDKPESLVYIIVNLQERVKVLERDNEEIRKELSSKLSTHDIERIANSVDARLTERLRINTAKK